ncbi:hypothetical protein U8607_11355 [Methylobacterium durans]|uniref:hypothetical protein n=1 Tax=Methylobacterium durans TaxID=2202825 RepID=UPI002AFE6C0F|nr:hypothetical protein [Methylobacterium durans]MEA1832678.1 hypothetical protein [Methylobacterium durans]
MSASLVTLLLTATFVAGCVSIHLLRKWAVQVAEGLAAVLFTVLALLTALLIGEPARGGSESIATRIELLGDPFGTVQARLDPGPH